MSGARFQHFFELPAAQYEALKKDIEARGLVLPILVDEDDKVIDGHQRRRVCAELHVDCPRIVVEGLSDDEKHSLAIALNLFRRQLGGVERSKAIGEMSRLGLSQRRIAEAIGVSARTVGRALEGAAPAAPDGVDPATGEITGEPNPAAEGGSPEAPGSPEPRKVKGKDGKSYPARKPPTPVDPDVGYRARVSTVIKQTNEGLRALDPERVAQVCAQADRAAWSSFFDAVIDDATKHLKALSASTLKAVK